MRTTEVQSNLTVTPARAGGQTAAPTVTAVSDKVSTAETEAFQSSLASSVRMAATERQARLSALAQAVRSGAYRPSASALADQILAEAELDARLAKALS